ncbi:F-box/LRR-repeat protein 13 [Lingula anatina]|uniref:F-box/LRR-repeat protein 13 n=1 Tax=Lingula anatina TaxID=7574 RepID=A0A1S3KDU8_LINAN|nr:F-box/LRR-repeat protein 13 [Lingula anatina]|eukprot:XP_013420800.1 F-box/LRR-repeat protein 13 [Lingula anatina]
MPRRICVPSLKRCCLVNVVKNMDDVWCKESAEMFAENQQWLYVLGPFEHLTSDTIQEIIDVLIEKKTIKRIHLQLLLQTRIQKLRVDVQTGGLQTCIVQLVGWRCRKLTKLDISSCRLVPAKSLAEMVSGIPDIVSLNLNNTQSNDQVLCRIAVHCRRLRELNVAYCNIKDAGALSLCGGSTPDTVDTGCPELITLDFEGTNISQKAQIIILSSLHHLHNIKAPSLFQAIQELGCSDTRDLSKLRSLDVEATDEDIAAIHLLCPGLAKLYLTCLRVNNLEVIAELSHLQSLTLLDENQSLSFTKVVYPVLKLAGARLKSLILLDVFPVSISFIGSVCPHLGHFGYCLYRRRDASSLDYQVANLNMDAHVGQKYFQHLMTLEVSLIGRSVGLDGMPGPEYLTRIDVNCLLSHCLGLRDINFRKVQAFSDEVFSEVFTTNRFLTTKQFALDKCHEISDLSIRCLVEQESDLEVLKLWKCKKVFRAHFMNYEDYAQRNHLNLRVQWT